MKLWAGRFQKETDKLVDDFNTSLPFDCRMYRQDIRGSMAHAAMLQEKGIISKQDLEEILKGLESILADMDDGKLLPEGQEDIHMFVESILTERVGDAGKRLHTARSRNDQVALDLRLYLEEELKDIEKMLLELLKVICRQAEANTGTHMPGYTHLQRGQPITFAQHLLAYASMIKRDIRRLINCREGMMAECPLGSGALAGTTYPIDRFMTANSLGFAAPSSNSLDGVSDRDYAIEFLAAASIIMMHLSRFSEEIILWCSWEFRFVELDDAYSTGSSIMPQKKNPDVAELVRGKTGRVYGALMTLLTVMKGLPLAYNKDMQEDKEAVFDAVDTLKMCLPVFSAMVDTMRVRPANMAAAAKKGFINATDCADYLTRKGMPFRDAYKVTGKLVFLCTDTDRTLEELSLAELKEYSELFDEDIYDAISLDTCVGQRKSYGGPAPEQTLAQIELVKKFIADHE